MIRPDGNIIEESEYQEFIKPPNPIPPFITNLTGISNDTVSKASNFKEVCIDWLMFCNDVINNFESENGIQVENLILVAHNRQ